MKYDKAENEDILVNIFYRLKERTRSSGKN
jgi:hypothetical protein